jgi:hypothetical protein
MIHHQPLEVNQPSPAEPSTSEEPINYKMILTVAAPFATIFIIGLPTAIIILARKNRRAYNRI